MEKEKMQEHFVIIGQMLANMIGSDLTGTYLQSEGDEGFYSIGIFQDEGNRVFSYAPSKELSDVMEDFWRDWTPPQWPVVMHYEVSNGQFSVEFEYAEQHDPEHSSSDRLKQALVARYGDKTIVDQKPHDWPEITETDLSNE
jgi:hypothetical protein